MLNSQHDESSRRSQRGCGVLTLSAEHSGRLSFRLAALHMSSPCEPHGNRTRPITPPKAPTLAERSEARDLHLAIHSIVPDNYKLQRPKGATANPSKPPKPQKANIPNPRKMPTLHLRLRLPRTSTPDLSIPTPLPPPPITSSPPLNLTPLQALLRKTTTLTTFLSATTSRLAVLRYMSRTSGEARELRRVVRREARRALGEVGRVVGECGVLCEIVTRGEKKEREREVRPRGVGKGKVKRRRVR